jgi:GGDEF domain-containing protein
LPEERFRALKALANGDRVATSEVMADSDGMNVMQLVKAVGDQIAVGTFSTRYINQLGKNIAFGVLGHAAIVDHAGNVLSHPLDSWIAERRNIAKVSSVQRMLAGETGVETFYSPALKGDMIAGLTAVQPVGWGVMVPQPVVELHAKAERASRSALLIMALGFLASAVIGLAAAFWIARPIEALSDSSRQVASGRYVTPRLRRWLPAELASLQTSFASMIGKLRLSLMEVNRLAYTDGVTGLANRTYFLRRAVNVIDHSKRESRSCSLLFIDLDGFKPVNDNLGHDMGDIVLKSVADRLADHFRVLPVGDLIDQNPLECDIAPDEVIVARLGGDEFAVLVAGAGDESQALAMGEEILSLLVVPFHIHEQAIRIGASIGIACTPRDGSDLTTLLKKADIAMYNSKRTGRNKVSLFDRSLRQTLDSTVQA